MFEVDPAALERANAALARLNKGPNYDHLIEEEKKEEDGRSMLEVMREKREAAEAALAAQKANQPAQPTGETIEERKARLQAQRDMLRRLKEEKRQQELNEFNVQLNSDTNSKPNLAEEFKQMDAKKQLPAS